MLKRRRRSWPNLTWRSTGSRKRRGLGRPTTPLLFVALLSGADHLAAHPKVEARGITSKVRIEEVVSGHLVELNGRFKLRATEVTFAPEAVLGVHHHVGLGVRHVLSGKVTFTQGGKA
jgi:quercetin dioxygenase-like cupin family protein